MIPVPHDVMNDYVVMLRSREVPPAQFEYYKKWLRYFYDFYAKYLDTDDKPEKVKLFLDKLRSKGQTQYQCQQAAHAVSLYFEIQSQRSQSEVPGKQATPQQKPVLSPSEQVPPADQATYFKQRKSQYSVAGYEEKSSSLEWDEIIAKMAGEIIVRHYSRRTLQTYAHWSRQFQRFLKNKPRDSNADGSLQPEDDDDLNSLRAGADGEGTAKSAGYMNTG